MAVYFAQPLIDRGEIWEKTKEILPATYEGQCALISWNDYLSGYDALVFDLSKLKTNLSTENAQVTIINNSTLEGNYSFIVGGIANPLTLVNVIEVERCVLLSLSNQAVALTVGSNNIQ